MWNQIWRCKPVRNPLWRYCEEIDDARVAWILTSCKNVHKDWCTLNVRELGMLLAASFDAPWMRKKSEKKNFYEVVDDRSRQSKFSIKDYSNRIEDKQRGLFPLWINFRTGIRKIFKIHDKNPNDIKFEISEPYQTTFFRFDEITTVRLSGD